MPPVPEHIGPYRVLRPIATGGTAEVYEVQDPASGERFALKLLVAVRTSLKRFDREYEAMTRLNHPGIVRVYHYGLHQGHPWLTMELVRGVPAQTHIKQSGRAGSPERNDETARIGYHVARALGYVHDRKLVHRDLKSANVLVLPDERVKLLDFGAAHLLDAIDRITLDGEFVGTFAYASPEQLLGRQVDHRSDLYSLGVLLFRLATGRRPYEAEDPQELGRQHLHDPVPDPKRLAPGLPDALVHLILELLAKAPTDRPPTAEHVAQRLEALHGRPFSTRSRLAVQEPASASRESERRRIWAHLEEGPPSALVIVDGEEGSDRARVLDRIRADAAERGWGGWVSHIRRGQAVQRLVDTLMQLVGECDRAQAVPLAEALRASSTPEALANPRERAVLRQSAVGLATLRTRKGPGILFVHEVHRADPLTLELLGGLRRALQGADAPFKIVASCRANEIEGPSELARRLGDAFRIRLDPLGPREVAVAVGNMLGRRPPPAELARRLQEVTAGQPLYLEEAIDELVAAGGIEADGSRLAWADQAMEVPPPRRATANALLLLENLPVTWRRTLEALALAQDATEPPVVARVLGWTVPELKEVLDPLVARGILRWSTEGGHLRPQWRHPALPELVGSAIPAYRRRVLERHLADAVRGLPATRGGVRAMAGVGRLGDALRAAVGLGRTLVKQAAVRSALEVLDPVVSKLPEAERSLDAGEAFLLHARCLRTVQPTDPSSARSLARARVIAEAEGDANLLARTSLAQARLYKVIGHYGNFRKYLQLAWEQQPRDTPGLAAEIASELSRSFRWHGDLTKAETWVETALSKAEASDQPAVFAEAVLQAANCRMARGHVDDAEQSMSRAMQEFDRADDRVGFWRALARWSGALRHQGRYSDALSQLYQRLPESSQSQDPTPYVELLLATAWIELDLSRLGRAQECTDELAATVHRGEHLHLRLESQLLNGRILLASGQYRSAAYVLQEVHRSARSADLPVLSEHARALFAETMYALGDREASVAAFQSAVLGLLGSGDTAVLADGVRGRARTQATDRDPDELFKPVARLLEEEPMPLLRLESLLARGAWHRQRGDRDQARVALREAAMVLNRVATGLNDTDRAALRVHPWSGWIRRGLR